MVEYEWQQESELRDGIVRGSCSLHTLQSFDSNANMCLSNHVNIISAVSDAHCDSPCVFFSNHLHYFSFLFGRDSAGKYDCGLIDEFYELVLYFLICEYLLEGVTTNNHSHLLLLHLYVLLVLGVYDLIVDI